MISREVEVGQTVVSSMNVANLYTIADLDNMQVIGNVDEADIGQVKMGQRVTFSVDAYPDDLFEGLVTQVRLNPTTESNVVTYEVVVNAPNPEHKLIPGLTANLTIYVMSENNVLLLPAKAFAFTPRIIPMPKIFRSPANPCPHRRSMAAREQCVGSRGQPPRTESCCHRASNGLRTVITGGLSEGGTVATGYNAMARQGGGDESTQSPFAPPRPGGNKRNNPPSPSICQNQTNTVILHHHHHSGESRKEIIKVENLRREFMVGGEKVKALRGVSFTIREGEFVTIMGTSGSGKSTLLNILGCLDTPDLGRVYPRWDIGAVDEQKPKGSDAKP